MSSQVLSIQQAERTEAIEVWARLLRGHTVLRREFDAKLQAEHGLTVSGYEALLLLSRAERNAMRRVDLAEGLQLTASGVTRLLSGLEEAGLVEKETCSTDGRVTYALLTKAGRRKLEESARSHIAAVRDLFEDLFTQDELVLLVALLCRLPGAGNANGELCSPPGHSQSH
jgi:DNA-binding MarR family transcriptional regulator